MKKETIALAVTLPIVAAGFLGAATMIGYWSTRGQQQAVIDAAAQATPITREIRVNDNKGVTFLCSTRSAKGIMAVYRAADNEQAAFESVREEMNAWGSDCYSSPTRIFTVSSRGTYVSVSLDFDSDKLVGIEEHTVD